MKRGTDVAAVTCKLFSQKCIFQNIPDVILVENYFFFLFTDSTMWWRTRAMWKFFVLWLRSATKWPDLRFSVTFRSKIRERKNWWGCQESKKISKNIFTFLGAIEFSRNSKNKFSNYPLGHPKHEKIQKNIFFCWNCNKINWFGKGSFKILFLRKKVPFLEVPLLGREITDFVFGISGKFNGAQKLKKKFRVNFRFLTTSSIFFFENIDFRISLE